MASFAMNRYRYWKKGRDITALLFSIGNISTCGQLFFFYFIQSIVFVACTLMMSETDVTLSLLVEHFSGILAGVTAEHSWLGWNHSHNI